MFGIHRLKDGPSGAFQILGQEFAVDGVVFNDQGCPGERDLLFELTRLIARFLKRTDSAGLGECMGQTHPEPAA